MIEFTGNETEYRRKYKQKQRSDPAFRAKEAEQLAKRMQDPAKLEARRKSKREWARRNRSKAAGQAGVL